MIGYPLTYGDYLSGSEAMKRRADFVDKGLVFVIIWSINTSIANARGFPANKVNPDQCSIADAPVAPSSPSPNPPVFAPIAGVCSCTSPEVKTAILLAGIGAICYSALCSNEKPLVAACSALAAYAGTKLGDG